jgi:hypothetical protein
VSFRQQLLDLVPRQNSIRVREGSGFESTEQFSIGVSAEKEVLIGYGLRRGRSQGGGQGPSGTLLPPFIFNSDKRRPKQQFRRQDRSDDANRRALAPIQSRCLLWLLPLALDPQAFPSPEQDVSGRRGSNGRTRSSGVSDAVH